MTVVLGSCLVYIFLALNDAIALRCPPTWAKAGTNMCLKPAYGTILDGTFEDAMEICGKQNASLVYPKTIGEISSLKAYLASLASNYYSNIDFVWLGIDDRGIEGTYQSGGVNAAFLRWNPTQLLNDAETNCVILDIASEKFDMSKCDRKMAIICQVPKVVCDDNYEAIGEKCMKVVSKNVVLIHEAAASCAVTGGTLPAPTNEDEFSDINDYQISRQSGLLLHYHIGVKFFLTNWRFISNSQVTTYMPWKTGQPDSGYEYCICGRTQYAAKYYSSDCEKHSRPYFCVKNGTFNKWIPPLTNGVVEHKGDGVLEFSCFDGFVLRGNPLLNYDPADVYFLDSSPFCEHLDAASYFRTRTANEKRGSLPIKAFQTKSASKTACLWFCEATARCITVVFGETMCFLYDGEFENYYISVRSGAIGFVRGR